MFEIIFEASDTIDQRREQIQSLLQENVCAVTFTKVNGEQRIMPCTLMPNLLPPAPVVEKAKPARPEPVDTMSVWCTDQNAWRSFRLENVQTLRILESK